MTKEDIAAIEAKLTEAKALVETLALCDKYDIVAESMSVRHSCDSVPYQFSILLISVGLKAVRAEAEAKLAAMKIVAVQAKDEFHDPRQHAPAY